MARRRLKEHVLSRAENRPGVYRWLSGDGRILYVGKSVRTRSRLLSYFGETGGKVARLVREAAAVAWDYVPNEFAALHREMRLIRAWQPDYNVEHKRGRRVAFVKVTRERAPRVVVATRVEDDGARYYGPFSRVGWLAEATSDLARALGLRDCPGATPVHFGDQVEMFSPGRPPMCLRAETGSCLAPCAGRCTGAEYRGRASAARAFLEGRGRAPLEAVARAMEAAAERLAFEEAARLRDRLARLEKLRNHVSAFPGRRRNMNLVYSVPGFGGEDRLYLIRRGRLHSDLPLPKTVEDRQRAAGVVEAVFRPAAEDRDAGLDAGAAAEALLAAKWFSRRPRERRRAMEPNRWLATCLPAAACSSSSAAAESPLLWRRPPRASSADEASCLRAWR